MRRRRQPATFVLTGVVVLPAALMTTPTRTGPYNTYSSAPGADVCDACPENTIAGLGQAYCSKCLPGEREHAADASEITCLRCQNGTFSPLGLFTLATFSGLLLSSDVVHDDGWSLLGLGTFLAICTALVVVLGLVLAVLEAKQLLEKLAAAASTRHRRSIG